MTSILGIHLVLLGFGAGTRRWLSLRMRVGLSALTVAEFFRDLPLSALCKLYKQVATEWCYRCLLLRRGFFVHGIPVRLLCRPVHDL